MSSAPLPAHTRIRSGRWPLAHAACAMAKTKKAGATYPAQRGRFAGVNSGPRKQRVNKGLLPRPGGVCPRAASHGHASSGEDTDEDVADHLSLPAIGDVLKTLLGNVPGSLRVCHLRPPTSCRADRSKWFLAHFSPRPINPPGFRKIDPLSRHRITSPPSPTPSGPCTTSFGNDRCLVPSQSCCVKSLVHAQ